MQKKEETLTKRCFVVIFEQTFFMLLIRIKCSKGGRVPPKYLLCIANEYHLDGNFFSVSEILFLNSIKKKVREFPNCKNFFGRIKKRFPVVDGCVQIDFDSTEKITPEVDFGCEST